MNGLQFVGPGAGVKSPKLAKSEVLRPSTTCNLLPCKNLRSEKRIDGSPAWLEGPGKRAGCPQACEVSSSVVKQYSARVEFMQSAAGLRRLLRQ